MNEQLVKDFEQYANSLMRGFLKTWKAECIISMLGRRPFIMTDEVSFLAYLKNCLEMEGFSNGDCELIMGWLYERKQEIVA